MATVKTDVLPNIFVNFKQVKADRGNTVIPFNTTAFIKTKTGPIGEFTKISSYAEAVSKFGLGDETTPALYGIEQVLKSYGYINIVRLASAKEQKSDLIINSKSNPSWNFMTRLHIKKTCANNNSLPRTNSEIFTSSFITPKPCKKIFFPVI